MLITRETDYALRMLSALASGQQFTAGALCEQEMIPGQFGYKILKKLNPRGFVKIIRGKDGGCRLDCDLSQVTLYHLMKAIGEDIYISSCMEPGYECKRRKARNCRCSIHERLACIQKSFNQELKKYTLLDLIQNDSE